jgi:GMP synthase (glutamine-hydrolysing)
MNDTLENHPSNIHDQRILILDFGSQYTQLIARRIRECGVYCEIYPYDMADKEIESFAPNGIILSGGPESVTEPHTPRAPNRVFELGCPILGICYGMQTMALQLGGEVTASHAGSEFGYAQLETYGNSPLLADIEDHIADNLSLIDVWMSHGDKVTRLPEGFQCIASSKDCTLAGMANEARRFYGLQFHPEVTHTRQGLRILKHFLYHICGCDALWTPQNIIEDRIAQVQQEVADDKILLGLSGGVDSSVVAALLHRAIGDKLICVFVDTGLLRENEGDEVMQTFSEHMGIKVIRVNAASLFFTALKGISDPEEKRKIIGKLFIDVFQEQAQKLSGIKWLAQGTIYPDVIESAASKTGKAHVIKSHHNVGGLPENMQFSLIEPLRELFKDEVRKIGLELGLPYDMLYRHPFPGPGLGVRILGEVKIEYADILRKADKIFMEALRQHDLYYKTSQAFAVFLPVKSVGVGGDARKYEYVISLRAVETIDFMTAHAAELPYAFLKEVSRRILNEVKGVSRVVYDISDKPPATIEWE